MNLSRKCVLSFTGVATAALLIAVASPRTVHALGEQLVSIANTATHPAVVETFPTSPPTSSRSSVVSMAVNTVIRILRRWVRSRM